MAEKNTETNTEKDAKREACRAARAAKKQARAERRAARKAERKANGGGVWGRVKPMLLFIGSIIRWAVWLFVSIITYFTVLALFLPLLEQTLTELASSGAIDGSNLSVAYLVSIGGLSGAAVLSVPAMFKLLERLWKKAVEQFHAQRDAALESSTEDVVAATKDTPSKRRSKKKKRK